MTVKGRSQSERSSAVRGAGRRRPRSRTRFRGPTSAAGSEAHPQGDRSLLDVLLPLVEECETTSQDAGITLAGHPGVEDLHATADRVPEHQGPPEPPVVDAQQGDRAGLED